MTARHTTRVSRDERFLAMAVVVSSGATCARRRVGCVLVDRRGLVLSTGCNGPASGEDHCIDHHCPGVHAQPGQGLDACCAVHAEANALMQCRDVWQIYSAYLTTSPCVSCVKMLMNTSCRDIVFVEEYPHKESRDLWLGSNANRGWDAARTWNAAPHKFEFLQGVCEALGHVP